MYFLKISYDFSIYGIFESFLLDYLKDKFFILVIGIVNFKLFVDFLKEKNFNF